jgi:hypothetical protein
LIAIPLGILIALAIASMIGWIMLGLPVAAYDPLRMPQFVSTHFPLSLSPMDIPPFRSRSKFEHRMAREFPMEPGSY